MSQLHKVFVYGTLKRGEPNHNSFSKTPGGYYKFLHDAETVKKYPLIIGTKYNIPFLLFSPGNGSNVQGELYDVDDTVLADLDALEDHPNFYVREEDEVRALNSEEKTKTWIYFIKTFKDNLLQKTTYQSYSNEGGHGLKYVGSEESTMDDLNC